MKFVMSNEAADLEWLLHYLQAYYLLGLPDAGNRICIGGHCGADFAEAVRTARIAYNDKLYESIMGDIGQ